MIRGQADVKCARCNRTDLKLYAVTVKSQPKNLCAPCLKKTLAAGHDVKRMESSKPPDPIEDSLPARGGRSGEWRIMLKEAINGKPEITSMGKSISVQGWTVYEDAYIRDRYGERYDRTMGTILGDRQRYVERWQDGRWVPASSWAVIQQRVSGQGEADRQHTPGPPSKQDFAFHVRVCKAMEYNTVGDVLKAKGYKRWDEPAQLRNHVYAGKAAARKRGYCLICNRTIQ